MRYKVKSPQVIHQTIDDEVVIISLESGNYYSLRGSGTEIWAQLERGATIDEVLAALHARYDGSSADERIEALFEQLEAEDLIAPVGDNGSGSSQEQKLVDQPEADRGTRFQPPILERYDDMQDLILLDPVHEVDDAEGWPAAGNRADG